MNYQQTKQYLYRITMLAQHNATQTPPITEIKIPREDLKYLLAHHSGEFVKDAQGNSMVDGSRLVAI